MVSMSELLLQWRWTARTANVANLRATDSLGWRNFVLGGTAAVLGAVVSLGIFATLESSDVALGVRIAAGTVAALAAALTALGKYLNYASRAEAHRKASRAYGDLVRQIDAQLDCGEPLTLEAVTTIRKAMDKIDDEAPNVAPLMWMWAAEGVQTERAAQDAGKPSVDASTVNRGARPRLRRLKTRLFG
jgi:hypothetical protein